MMAQLCDVDVRTINHLLKTAFTNSELEVIGQPPSSMSAQCAIRLRGFRRTGSSEVRTTPDPSPRTGEAVPAERDLDRCRESLDCGALTLSNGGSRRALGAWEGDEGAKEMLRPIAMGQALCLVSLRQPRSAPPAALHWTTPRMIDSWTPVDIALLETAAT